MFWPNISQTAQVTARDVTESASASVGCGFHVQNPLDADADLLHDQNYQLL